MKKVIVTTTINAPTKAIEKFQSLPDWELVVIGDKKTPQDFHLISGIYVPREEQEKYDKELSDDPVGATNHEYLWHRGYPLQLLAERDYFKRSMIINKLELR